MSAGTTVTRPSSSPSTASHLPAPKVSKTMSSDRRASCVATQCALAVFAGRLLQKFEDRVALALSWVRVPRNWPPTRGGSLDRENLVDGQ